MSRVDSELGICYELRFVWSLMTTCGLLEKTVCYKQFSHYATHVHWLVDLMYSVFKGCPMEAVSSLIAVGTGC